MIKDNLKQINSAPPAGHVLAYFRKSGLFFERYDVLEPMIAKLNDKMTKPENNMLLELHMFNESMEYRCVTTEAKSRTSDYIEYLATFEEEEDSVYAEVVELDDKVVKLEKQITGRLVVLNHITYQENGMAVIDDYRLQMKEV